MTTTNSQSPSQDFHLEELTETGTTPTTDRTQHPSRKSWSREQYRVLTASCVVQLPIWGFAMSYGVVQDHYNTTWSFNGNESSTGVIGTTFNGIIYISMPLLFAAFTQKYARYRKPVALLGSVIACSSYLLAAFSTDVWQLIATQGVIAAIGSGLIYTPCTLTLGEWFSPGDRALVYGLTLSSKNIVGSACPFLLQYLLTEHGYKTTLLTWANLVLVSALAATLLMPTQQPSSTTARHSRISIPWHFLKHKTFYIYSLAILLQSSGYGIPQTYFSAYAHDSGAQSPASATLLLTLFNLPGILSSSFFGYLCKAHIRLQSNARFPNSTNSRPTRLASTLTSPISTTLLSSIPCTLSALLLWGLTPRSNLALLILFALVFGCFAGGYSGTWGGMISEMEAEAASNNEAVDAGLVYGLLNGARGVGYVAGGLLGLVLLNAGRDAEGEGQLPSTVVANGFQTEYWAVIVFTGVSTVFGGAGVFLGSGKLWKRVRGGLRIC